MTILHGINGDVVSKAATEIELSAIEKISSKNKEGRKVVVG